MVQNPLLVDWNDPLVVEIEKKFANLPVYDGELSVWLNVRNLAPNRDTVEQ